VVRKQKGNNFGNGWIFWGEGYSMNTATRPISRVGFSQGDLKR